MNENDQYVFNLVTYVLFDLHKTMVVFTTYHLHMCTEYIHLGKDMCHYLHNSP